VPAATRGLGGMLRYKFKWHCCEMCRHWQTEARAVPVTNRISGSAACVNGPTSEFVVAMAVDQGLSLCTGSFFRLAASR
jgi:hypothetical protein